MSLRQKRPLFLFAGKIGGVLYREICKKSDFLDGWKGSDATGNIGILPAVLQKVC